MPTGTGKSIIIATLVDAFSSNTNIVTSRVSLTKQLSQSVTVICENHALGIVAGKYNNHADVTIGTYNAFRNNNLPQDSKITIFDEAHNLHGEKQIKLKKTIMEFKLVLLQHLIIQKIGN
jgi:superfamily II DNA or RNA helicase